MDYFDAFVSNSLAGSGNQYVFESDEQPHTARIYYQLTFSGTWKYSLLFGNTINGTFADGSVSKANDVITGWKLFDVKVGCTREINNDTAAGFRTVTFSGEKEKVVGEKDVFFSTDPIQITAKKGDYLCVELSYCGKKIPNHEESIISAFLLTENGWIPTRQTPYPLMIGCDRCVSYKLAYLGDSITQGIGTAENSYEHWNAVLTRKLIASSAKAGDMAFWNLGLGYGRAGDAASNGVWLEEAKRNDYVILCYGVNDLYHSKNGGMDVIDDLRKTVQLLKAAGVKVMVQTVPPFDYPVTMVDHWKRINEFILNELSAETDAVFDNVKVLGDISNHHPENAVYGGHPNEEGCLKWAEALLPEVLKFLEK